ncbi:MAG: tannase/feruloyl esterase family alpha/beta hydrolase [Steroidobacteraceae bacterium]
MRYRGRVDRFDIRLAVSALGLAAWLAVGAMAHAQAFSDAKSAVVDYANATLAPAESCRAIGRYRNRELREIHANHVAATPSAPSFCRVTGVLATEIAFEIALPDRWNGRFYMIGNGGLAGEALEDRFRIAQRDAALRNGFAFAQTNTGHDARKEPSGTFVLSNPQKAIDYAYRAVNLTAVTAKAVTRRYYRTPIVRSYWNSCSNGGRQGLIEAERYPRDFDGILVNSPWVDQTGFTLGAIWNQRAIDAAPLTAAKLALLARHVMEKCDAVDGLKDGLIDDPRNCRFDARRDVPACAAGVDNDSCLTAAQADAIMKIYGGPVSKGKPVFPGYMLGSEAVIPSPAGGIGVSGWINLIVPAGPGHKAADFNLAEGTMRYLVFSPPRPQYDYRTFDFDRDIPLLASWGKKADATNTDLSAFRERGGKLLMTYGWADPILQPMAGVEYYEKALARNGPKTPDFFRLFMVPGMGHCGGGIGTDRFDAMTALIDWVEKRRAPEVIHASRAVRNEVVRSRPLCPYPEVARYSGRGSIDEAANFSCVQPRAIRP